MQEKSTPHLARFEQAVENKNYQLACDELFLILRRVDGDYGMIEGVELGRYPIQLDDIPNEKVLYFCTKMANLIATLFQDPNFIVPEDKIDQFFEYHRWISFIFASSPYINTDHILYSYNLNKDAEKRDELLLPNDTNILIKFCLLYSLESNIDLNFDAFWALNPSLCASLCFALQTPRFIATPKAFSKRAFLLQWFPEKLKEIKYLDNFAYSLFLDVYMHCSYDMAKNKHDIKGAINEVMRNFLERIGWEDRNIKQIEKTNNKPVMVVLLEHFHAFHSIYRTHSTSLIAAKQHFHIIGLGYEKVDAVGRAVFDEFHVLNQNTLLKQLDKIKQICEEHQAAIFYMPSIGMEKLTILTSNTRMAPIQAIALGHPATTHSKFIEYVVVEDDYVGSEDCFSETLIRLPKDALPYVPSSLAPEKVDYILNENPEVVNIGIATTGMKLNYHFLETLQTILERSKVKIHFHFAFGIVSGVNTPYVERFIKSYLGNNATMYFYAPYTQYLENLRHCDMMINPFPFGNTNGIIDMVTLGLVGVCKTGNEVHEHIDEGLFKRLGLPDWLVTHTIEEYIDCTLRLAENHQERLNLRRKIIEQNGLNTLFTGNALALGKVFLDKVNQWEEESKK
ncbi:UDP-glucose:protein N-beta-glucosyltransferase [Phocoenobacter skyensis]|uniref:UDP-glucose:protein N-beta-glucosyltransferase n=1 Tax=Phocoenobacter skyensis TaxID=97481 RepID=UPI002763E851|nr:adhesin [Pasteurella skyensis]MDP8184823.1 adhesin [Pasteurella skyensis]